MIFLRKKRLLDRKKSLKKERKVYSKKKIEVEKE